MGEEQRSRFLGAILIKKGDAVPPNAIPMTEQEVLMIQTERIKAFQPQSEMQALNYGTHMLAAYVGLSGWTINSIFRKNFRLGGMRRLFTYAPSIVISGFLSGCVHELTVKRSILLGKEPCPTCSSLRSGALQLLIGVGYPYFVSILTCLPIAREMYTIPMPEGPKGTSFLKLLHQVSPKANILLLLGISNVFLGMWIAHRELKIFNEHLSKPPSNQYTGLDAAELLKE